MIRRATPADAEALSALSRTCFTQTFEHLYDPADLEAFLDEAYAPDVLRAELEDPNRATWLLFEDATDEAPIGYDVAPGDGELQRLYILQGHQGGGRGTLLLNTALEWLERDGPRTLWIGVWSENYGAQRFYARHGFEIVGEYSFMVGDHADRELITRRLPRALDA